MKRYQLTITLKEDSIFSERAASEGGHRSLDYIPGITLLGACASKIYKQLGTDAFDIFHSGKVRFGNGYPLSLCGEKSLPIPFAWHCEKGKETTKLFNFQRHTLISDNILNLSKIEMPKGKQPKQLRKGYVTNALELIQPETSLRMKTAIDPETATAAKSQLFGYQALQAGQRFSAYVDIDDDICAENSKQLLEALTGEQFLGRSRTAQYGSVECEIAEHDLPVNYLTGINSEKKEITIWFLSDTALLNRYGFPITANTLTIPGLETANIIWHKSYLRFRRYSPYNSKRRKFDLERQVIEKGSVLTLVLTENIEQQKLDRLQQGIGVYREAGLGQILVQHPLLKDSQPIPMHEPKQYQTLSPDMPNIPLARFLNQLHQSSKASRKDRQYAGQKAQELEKLYQHASAYAAVESSVDLGPSASQWSRIVEAGKQYQFERDRQKLLSKLFGDVTNKNENMQDTICKQKDEAWSVITFDNNDREITFRKWLYDTLKDKTIEQPGTVATLLAHMAINIVKKTRQTQQTSEKIS